MQDVIKDALYSSPHESNCWGEGPFPANVDLHQTSTLSPYIFSFVLNEVTMHKTCYGAC